MEKEFIFSQKEIDMTESWETAKKKDMESIFIQMGINMKDNGWKTKNMDMEFTHIC